MQVIGIIFIIISILDFALSLFGIDLYQKTGISIPDFLYSYTPVITGIFGAVIIFWGDSIESKKDILQLVDDDEVVLANESVYFSDDDVEPILGNLLITDQRVILVGLDSQELERKIIILAEDLSEVKNVSKNITITNATGNTIVITSSVKNIKSVTKLLSELMPNR